MYNYSESVYLDTEHSHYTVQETPFSKREWDGTYFTHRIHNSKWDSSYESYFWVISCGHECACPSLTHGPRVLDRLIIHYVVRGKGTFNGQPVHAGQFFFVHPCKQHTIVADAEDPFEYYYIGATGPGTKELIQRTGFNDIPEICDFGFAEKLPALFDDALYTATEEFDIELYLISLLYRLLSWHKKEFSNIPSKTITQYSYRYYRNALYYIDTCLADGKIVTPTAIADHLHISPIYLRRLFSQYCKYSMRELLLRKRINVAASYILTEEYSLEAIALLCGYTNYPQFHRIFKKYTGVSPSVYRQQGRQMTIISNNVDKKDAEDIEE